VLKYELNLRAKIILAFLGFSVFLSGLTIVGVVIATQMSETKSYRSRVRTEAEYYLNDYISSFTAPTSNSFNSSRPTSPFITHYFGNYLLPDWLKEKVGDKEPGTYFLENGKQKYCCLIEELPDGEIFYLLYNITRKGHDADSLKSLQITILLTLLPILLLGVSLGLITAHKVIGPVLKLAAIVRNKGSNEKLPDDFNKKFHNDEIGFLANALKESIDDMHEAIERETSFARDASHEIRTPVTIIKNSLELLDELNVDLPDSVKKVHGRIARSTYNMEHLIKSFLWLSRRENLQEYEESRINIESVVNEVVAEQSFLLENKSIDVSVVCESDAEIKAEPHLVKIIIANLVRNAFTYTKTGSVKMTVRKTCFEIEDTGRGIKPEVLSMMRDGVRKVSDKGFGLGISIVKRLCNSLGWSLYIFSEPEKGTIVRICYNIDESCGNCEKFNLQSGIALKVEHEQGL
jgi:signal transduction histidine kinase